MTPVVFTKRHSGGFPKAAGPGNLQINTVSPSQGYVAGGTPAILAGSGFTGATNVTFGGTSSPHFTVDSDVQITAFSPINTTVGGKDVVVTTPAGSATKTNGFTYDITSRPVYSSFVHTSIFDDSAVAYTTATSAGAHGGTYPRMAPNHSPTYDGGSVDTTEVAVVTPGYNGSTGYSFRMVYPTQTTGSNGAPSWAMVQADNDADFSPPTNKVMYADFYFRWQYAGSNKALWPKFFAHSWGVGGNRMEIGIYSEATSRTPDPYDTSLVYWSTNDNGSLISYQPIGPYPVLDCTDGSWYRFTSAYYPPQTLHDNLAICRVWVAAIGTAPESTQKIIGQSFVEIGVTPPGGQTDYVRQTELDNFKVANTIQHLWWGNVSAHPSSDGANLDISGVTWWREP